MIARWAPFTLKSHYVIYLDSWREQCSRAPGPQDPLKGLYIAATTDRRFYRVLYKYVNRCYLIGVCGYTSVPQREQSCEKDQGSSSLHSEWASEIEMFHRLTAGQGGATVRPFQGELSALEEIPSSLGRLLPIFELPLLYSSLQLGSRWPCTLLVIPLNCLLNIAPAGIALTFLCILKYVLAVTQGKENKVFGTLISWLVIS